VTFEGFPLAEEPFFRGYARARFDEPAPDRRVSTLAVLTALFRAMHDRRTVAAVTGAIFALIDPRRRRLVSANPIVALWTLGAGGWGAT
jgi:hypothetical protein